MIEFIEGERTKDFGFFDEDHVFFGDHEVTDTTFVESHDSGDAAAVFCGKNGFWGVFDELDEFGESLGSELFFGREGDFLGGGFFDGARSVRTGVSSIFIEFWVDFFDEIAQEVV